MAAERAYEDRMTRKNRPLYRQIADELRARIADGVRAPGAPEALAPGAQLPTEHELAEKHDTTRATVRQALNLLVNEGLVERVRPRGHFVRERRPMVYRPQAEFRAHPASAELDRFMTAMAEEGRTSSQTIDVAIVSPPWEVAERLKLAPGEHAAVRRRVRSVDDQPYNVNDSYFPLRLVEGSEIMNPGDIARGANMVLTELGYEQVRALDEIHIRMPTPQESQRLDLADGTPVAVHIATGFTASGLPVRCVINVLPGDRHVITYERHQVPLGSPGATITVRQARRGDVDTARQITEEVIAWLRTRGTDQWQDLPMTERLTAAAEAGTLFMVDAGGSTIGTFILDEHADPEFWLDSDGPQDALYVHRLAIRRAAAGHEVGAALLDWASRRAQAVGKRWLRLDAWRTNQGLHRYYTTRGWKLVRTVDVTHRGSGALFQRTAGTTHGAGPSVNDLTGKEA